MSGQRGRRDIAAFSTRIWEAGWVGNHDGNVSTKTTTTRFLITPTATSKRLCTPESLVECEIKEKGVSVLGAGKPPGEVNLHSGAYRAREDVTSVIHAHPPYLTAYSLAQVGLGKVVLPEAFVSLGEDIPLVELLLAKDPKLEDAIGRALATADVAILAGNGALAVGPDLETAYLRMEVLEHYAKIVTIARGGVIGPPAALADDVRAKLIEMRRTAGLLREPTGEGDPLRKIVAEEVRRVWGTEK